MWQIIKSCVKTWATGWTCWTWSAGNCDPSPNCYVNASWNNKRTKSFRIKKFCSERTQTWPTICERLSALGPIVFVTLSCGRSSFQGMWTYHIPIVPWLHPVVAPKAPQAEHLQSWHGSAIMEVGCSTAVPSLLWLTDGRMRTSMVHL
jgi:hypothetical protein